MKIVAVAATAWCAVASACAFDGSGFGGEGAISDEGGGGDDAGGAGAVAIDAALGATVDAGPGVLPPEELADATPEAATPDAAPEPPPPPPPIVLPAQCDVVTEAGCPWELGCHLFNNGAFCGQFGQGLEGASCFASTGCRRGLDCIDPGVGAGGVCLQLCWDNSWCNPTIAVCTAFVPALFVGGRQLGVCL